MGWVTLLVLLFFSAYRTHHARYISVIAPLLALAAAWVGVHGVRWGLRRWRAARLQPLALAGLAIGLLVWRLPSAVSAAHQTTGYAAALRALEPLASGDRQLFLATQPFVWRVFDRYYFTSPPATWQELGQQLGQGARYFLVDDQLDFGGFGTDAYRLAHELAAALQPVLILPNPAGASAAMELEHVYDPALTRRRLADPAVRAAMGRIAIYDLWMLPGVREALASAGRSVPVATAADP